MPGADRPRCVRGHGLRFRRVRAGGTDGAMRRAMRQSWLPQRAWFCRCAAGCDFDVCVACLAVQGAGERCAQEALPARAAPPSARRRGRDARLGRRYGLPGVRKAAKARLQPSQPVYRRSFRGLTQTRAKICRRESAPLYASARRVRCALGSRTTYATVASLVARGHKSREWDGGVRVLILMMIRRKRSCNLTIYAVKTPLLLCYQFLCATKFISSQWSHAPSSLHTSPCCVLTFGLSWLRLALGSAFHSRLVRACYGDATSMARLES